MSQLQTWRPAVGCVILALSLWLGVLLVPQPAPVWSTEQRLAVLPTLRVEAMNGGDFVTALALAREEADLLQDLLGPTHWQTIDALWRIDRMHPLAALPQDKRTFAVRGRWLLAQGTGLQARGQYAEAVALLGKTRAFVADSLGEDHLLVAEVSAPLCECLMELGKYNEALPLIRKSLASSAKILGESHPDTAGEIDRLARCLSNSDPKAALPHSENALRIRRAALGDSHPVTAESYNNTASCLQGLGHTQAALSFYQKALAIRVRIFGSRHSATAENYNNLAVCLDLLERPREALPHHQAAMEIRRRSLATDHPRIASSCNNTAACLDHLGRFDESMPLYENALAIYRRKYGESHWLTGLTYHNIAWSQMRQGQPGQALPTYEHALATLQRVVGEYHAVTAVVFRNLGHCLTAQGKYAAALPLFERALAIDRKVFGEDHVNTVEDYNCLAQSLESQGRLREALAVYEKSLVISSRLQGADSLLTAMASNNMASCLGSLGDSTASLALYQKALTIYEKKLGKADRRTAIGYNNVALALVQQGRMSDAEPLLRQTLVIQSQLQGEQHPETADAYNSLAGCLEGLGNRAEALPLYEKALAIRQHKLGRQHPLTAASYTNTGFCQARMGRTKEAQQRLQEGIASYDASRIQAAANGFDRARLGRQLVDPRQGLALLAVRKGEPRRAWELLEASLARGLLDDLASRQPEDLQAQDEIRRLDRRLVALFGGAGSAEEKSRQRLPLVEKRQQLLATLVQREAERATQMLVGLERLQKWLAADTALITWARSLNECQICVVRSRRDPVWVRLQGSGAGGAWTASDERMPEKFRQMVANPSSSPAERERLRLEVKRVWWDSLAPMLREGHGLPVARRLIIVPTEDGANLPWEAVITEHRISYVPSASLYVRLRERTRPVANGPLLALGDPAFRGPRSGDLSLMRGEEYVPLPGTRWEVQALQRLAGTKATVLLGAEANMQALEKLVTSGALRQFRLVHLATHGKADPERPEQSFLVLARDTLPNTQTILSRAGKGLESDGRLRVQVIRDTWNLDADLVTLSACETGLGRAAAGDGVLGFSQALLSRGARSVVLSRWRVDDEATALLMVRFYENFLGKRDRIQAMPRAAALHEAQRWLSQLTRQEAETLSLALANNRLADTARGSLVPLHGTKNHPPRPKGEHPYAAPYFWAAFVLVGDDT